MGSSGLLIPLVSDDYEVEQGAAELPINELLTTYRNLACSEMPSVHLHQLDSLAFFSMRFLLSECAMCHHKEHFYLLILRVYTTISFTHTHIYRKKQCHVNKIEVPVSLVALYCYRALR